MEGLAFMLVLAKNRFHKSSGKGTFSLIVPFLWMEQQPEVWLHTVFWAVLNALRGGSWAWKE